MSLFARNLLRILNPIIQSTSSRNIHETKNTGVKGVAERPDARTICTLIPGDGVGPELVSSVQEVFKAAKIPVEFDCHLLSEMNPANSAPLEEVVRSISRNGTCLKGSISSPKHSPSGESQTLNMKLRNALDLYANLVHVKALPGIKCKHNNIDFVIIREQTEGEYSALEHETVKGVVECLKIITSKKSERIARFAFDYATNNHRKKVTAIHKANIMKLGDGLFLRHCEEMAKLYPKIEFEKMIVDNCTMQIVTNPRQFDVMVTPNLYGNILDNISAGLVGGAGLVAGASYSSRCVVFEPGARHAYRIASGKNVANPIAMLLCASKLLKHVHLPQYGNMLKNAINCVLQEGKVRTSDIGGRSSTEEFTCAVIDKLELPATIDLKKSFFCF